MSGPKRAVFLTGEYPPTIGGVGDHTHLLAQALRDRGWTVRVHVVDGRTATGESLTAGRRLVDRAAVRDAVHQVTYDRPDLVILQYVPHMYARHGVNPWLVALQRGIRRTGVTYWVIAHELWLSFGGPARSVLSVAQRVQGRALMAQAGLTLTTTPLNVGRLRRLGVGRVRLLPVPSTIPVTPMQPSERQAERAALGVASGDTLIGEFSPFSVDRDPLGLVTALANWPASVKLLLIGGNPTERQREELDTLLRRSGMGERVTVTGRVTASRASELLHCLDVYVHTSPAGPTTRSTALGAALDHRLPVVAHQPREVPADWYEGRILQINGGGTPSLLAGAVDWATAKPRPGPGKGPEVVTWASLATDLDSLT